VENYICVILVSQHSTRPQRLPRPGHGDGRRRPALCDLDAMVADYADGVGLDVITAAGGLRSGSTPTGPGSPPPAGRERGSAV